MSDIGPWSRQPVTAREWQQWLQDGERLLWFYPRQGETREWSVRLQWGVGVIIVLFFAAFDWYVADGPSSRHPFMFQSFLAFGAFAFLMLVLDILGIRTKRILDAVNEAFARDKMYDLSMRQGSSALTQNRFLYIRDGRLTATQITDAALVTECRLMTEPWSKGGRVLLRHIGFGEERRLLAALKLARAIREGRAEVAA